MNSFYSQDELVSIGFKSIGESVLISRKTSIYGAANMKIGNNVRIDDFCILSGSITLGSNIHISAFFALYGSMGIEMDDYTRLSPRCTVFSASDDFSGDYLIGPMLDSRVTNVNGGKVIIKRYSQLGAGCVVLPNLTIAEGVAVGAMSLVTKSLDEWSVYVGTPVLRLKDRKRGLLNLMKND